MRLLHTTSLCFKEFFDNSIPPYAILSHRWDGKEVDFHEFEEAKERNYPEFSKIKNCCSFAKEHSRDWVWIDTCCIDKKSSAELSEAINSMFQWYKRARVCYVYLSSVDAVPSEFQRLQFRQSPWFTRGWTLQELIAPRLVYFLDRRWNIIGTKSELAVEISAITRIEKAHLNVEGSLRLDKVSIATKMSWVSKRTTSRVEDLAYCLLGIFDVNMPLLYGEGKKAFIRLQLEIIKISDDESIFAWTGHSVPTGSGEQGMLARWPTYFSGVRNVTPLQSPRQRPPYAMTNKGLEFRIPAYPSDQRDLKVVLNCGQKIDDDFLVATVMLYVRDNIGTRFDYTYAEFESPSEFEEQGSNTHVIYIPQRGL